MKQHRTLIAFLAALAVAPLAPIQAWAQDPVLESVAVDGPFPPPVAVALRPREDSELNARLRPVLEEELKALGILSDEWARVSLWYGTLSPAAASAARRPLGELRADSRSGVDMRMNVISTADSDLMGGRKESSPIPRPSDEAKPDLDAAALRLSLELSDTEAIRWRGQASLPEMGGDPYPDYEALLRALLPRLAVDAGWR